MILVMIIIIIIIMEMVLHLPFQEFLATLSVEQSMFFLSECWHYLGSHGFKSVAFLGSLHSTRIVLELVVTGSHVAVNVGLQVHS